MVSLATKQDQATKFYFDIVYSTAAMKLRLKWHFELTTNTLCVALKVLFVYHLKAMEIERCDFNDVYHFTQLLNLWIFDACVLCACLCVYVCVYTVMFNAFTIILIIIYGFCMSWFLLSILDFIWCC